MEYTFNQNHALDIINNIFFRLSIFWEKMELLKKCNSVGEIPYCKARRQGRELANEIDKYTTLACKIATKYLDGVDVDIYDDLGAWMKYDEAAKAYFQN